MTPSSEITTGRGLDARVQPFLIGDGWIERRDGDDSCRAIFDRHYSRYVYADGRTPKLFLGPGYKRVLMRSDGSALFCWRKFIDDCRDIYTDERQDGVNCAVFRNEGTALASALILEAESIPARDWPGERLYTYIDPKKVKPTMVRSRPVWGFCFYQAGWKFAGLTKTGLHILDKRFAS